MKTPDIQRHDVTIDGHTIHYRELGEGPPCLLIHGWPTSSFLWRNVMPEISTCRRVIAIDLPGFGESDKPQDVLYNLEFFRTILDGFVDTVGVGEDLALGVHDLGGPVGLYWASKRTTPLQRLVLFNTLVYPEFSWAVRAFMFASQLPGLSSLFTSQWGLGQAIKYGVHDSSRIRPDAIEGTRAPFQTRADREVLIRTLHEFTPAEFEEISPWLSTISHPVKIIYGARDRILPGIGSTVERLRDDIEDTDVTRLDDCGHFLQEERPQKVGQLAAEFLCA